MSSKDANLLLGACYHCDGNIQMGSEVTIRCVGECKTIFADISDELLQKATMIRRIVDNSYPILVVEISEQLEDRATLVRLLAARVNEELERLEKRPGKLTVEDVIEYIQGQPS